MACVTYAPYSLTDYKYVVVVSRFQGQWLLSRHRDRDTWETQGGHIEPGESPEAAAARELAEESGAEDFSLTPLCDYRMEGEGPSAHGMAFIAEIRALGALPHSEMAEARAFDALPANLTYPDITPHLFGFAERMLLFPGNGSCPGVTDAGAYAICPYGCASEVTAKHRSGDSRGESNSPQ